MHCTLQAPSKQEKKAIQKQFDELKQSIFNETRALTTVGPARLEIVADVSEALGAAAVRDELAARIAEQVRQLRELQASVPAAAIAEFESSAMSKAPEGSVDAAIKAIEAEIKAKESARPGSPGSLNRASLTSPRKASGSGGATGAAGAAAAATASVGAMGTGVAAEDTAELLRRLAEMRRSSDELMAELGSAVKTETQARTNMKQHASRIAAQIKR